MSNRRAWRQPGADSPSRVSRRTIRAAGRRGYGEKSSAGSTRKRAK